VAAAQEERFSRRKNDPSFPTESIRYCLKEANLTLDDVDIIVFYEDARMKVSRIIASMVAFAPNGLPIFLAICDEVISGKYWYLGNIGSALSVGFKVSIPKGKIRSTTHHLSHSASAFCPSPFRSAAILTVDGVGEYTTTSIGHGRDEEIETLREIQFPHSLGLFYSTFTAFLGFRVNSGEYKVMGLAPYGRPIYKDIIRERLIELKADGSFWLNMEFFEYGRNLCMYNEPFRDLFEIDPREPDKQILDIHADLAASVQSVLDEAMLGLARAASLLTGEKSLCMAGGVALNCVANNRILESGIFDNVWVQPAAGDAGGALGAAYIGEISFLGAKRSLEAHGDSMYGALLGPSFSSDEVTKVLDRIGAKYSTLGDDVLLDHIVDDLIDGKAIGWFSGRMEFGPRALGGRSIIADARKATMQRELNLKIKLRESFRPFAPAVLLDECGEWFRPNIANPYMLFTLTLVEDKRMGGPAYSEGEQRFGAQERPRSAIPAVTHLDYSARVQTVEDDDSRFAKLLKAFRKRTGTSVLINTSFNVRGEPIVCSPADAYRCFIGSGLDTLVIENMLLRRRDQNPLIDLSYSLYRFED
jgi:carbamoyltransferase